jgi:hypothetical protein
MKKREGLTYTSVPLAGTLNRGVSDMLTHGNKASWIATVWNTLEMWHGDELDPEDREQWDDICTAMAWIAEELNVVVED